MVMEVSGGGGRSQAAFGEDGTVSHLVLLRLRQDTSGKHLLKERGSGI